MFRPHRVPLLVGLLAALLVFGASQAPAETRLSGGDVAQITQTFLRNHYSRSEFGDEQSRIMLQTFISNFDAGHYYFLQSDVKEFQQYSTRLDDLLRRGNIDLAFLVFERFKKRLAERGEVIARLLKSKFDLTAEDSRVVDRKEEPYPEDAAAADRLWRKKLKFEILEEVLSGEKESEARAILGRRYRSARVQVGQYAPNEVVSMFVNAFTATFDPHSSYLSPDARENFDISLRLSLEGIGATLRWEDGLTVVSSIIAGGAAFREGTLKPDDRIVSVAQGPRGKFQDVRDMRLTEVVKLIRGKRGTTVRLVALRKGEGPAEERLEISIVRDKIALTEGEAKGRVMETKGGPANHVYRIGVITLPSFYVDFSSRNSNPENYKSSSRDVEKILKGFRAENVNGVILDLRNNGGGGLDEAISLSGQFLPPGPVVMVKTFRGRVQVYSNPHLKPLYKGPLLVLTNRYSASASEILAGALKDYGRAILVGDASTFGKGTVQNIIELPRGLGALKTTVAKFYRPGSSSTQNRGVVPDIVLPSLNNHLKIGESSLENALPWDAIGRVEFSPWGSFAPVIPVLGERSRIRRQGDPKFREIEKRVADYLTHRKGRNIVTVAEMVEQNKKRSAVPKEKPPPAHGKPSGTEAADEYLGEAAAILGDYIALSPDQQGPRIVNRQQ